MTEADTADLYDEADHVIEWAAENADRIGLHQALNEVQAPTPEEKQ